MKKPNMLYKKINSVLKKLSTGMYRINKSNNIEACNYGEGLVYKDKILTDSSVQLLKQWLLPMNNQFMQIKDHTEHHAAVSDAEIIEPVITKKRYMNSAFENENIQWTKMFEALVENRLQIKQFINGSYGKNGTFVIKSKDNTAKDKTNGFINLNNFIHRYTSDEYTTVVIKKDETTKNAALNMHIQTGYPGLAYNPDILSEEKRNDPSTPLLRESYNTIDNRAASAIQKAKLFLKISNEDCTDIVRRTNAYKNGNPMERTYFLFQANPKNEYSQPQNMPDEYDEKEHKPDIALSPLLSDTLSAPYFCVYVKQKDDTVISICAKENKFIINQLDENKNQIPLLPTKRYAILTPNDVANNTRYYQNIISYHNDLTSTLTTLSGIMSGEMQQNKIKDRKGIDIENKNQTQFSSEGIETK